MGRHKTASHVGEAVRHHRLAVGLTQQELARQTGVSVRALRDLEQGRVERPRARSIRRLANVLTLSSAERDALLAILNPDYKNDRQLQVDVLGPLVVSYGGLPVAIPSRRQRALLGLLALYCSQAVPTSELIDMLWGEHPPRTARNLVHGYVSELRALLKGAGSGLRSVNDGYALDLVDQRFDLVQFDDFVARAQTARSTGQPERAAELFARASQCWRGPVLADAGERLRQHPAATAIGRRRIATTVALADVVVGLGDAEPIISPLRALSHEEPLHEAVHGRLMLALATAGEQAEALRVFTDFRTRLADELGVEPSREVQEVHLEILRGVGRQVSGAGRSLWTCRIECCRMNSEGRRGMSDISEQDQRERIVWAATGLIAEWDTVTTGQIANAAGIDEATLLRAFGDKDAILKACVASLRAGIAAALDPTEVLHELQSISLDQPLAARLAQAMDALDAYSVRTRTHLEGLAASGGVGRLPAPGTGTPNEPRTPSFGSDDVRIAARLSATRQAVARLLMPDRQQLRLPAETLAEAFLGMFLGVSGAPRTQRSPLQTEQLVELFLYGAVTTQDPA